MPRIARRHHAVKEIHTACDSLDDVARRADTHQIARLVRRHIRLHRLDDLIHHLCRFPDGQPADGIARQIELRDLLHVPDAKVLKRRALIDAPELLAGIDRIWLRQIPGHRLLAASQPPRRPLAGSLGIRIGRRILYALVEGHRNVGAEI